MSGDGLDALWTVSDVSGTPKAGEGVGQVFPTTEVEELRARLVAQEEQTTRQTQYIKSMHTWAKRATDTLRTVDEQSKSADTLANIANQQFANQRAQLQQVTAENEANQRAIQQLQAMVATLSDQVRCLSEQPGSPSHKSNPAINSKKPRETHRYGLERLGSSELHLPECAGLIVVQTSTTDEGLPEGNEEQHSSDAINNKNNLKEVKFDPNNNNNTNNDTEQASALVQQRSKRGRPTPMMTPTAEDEDPDQAHPTVKRKM